MSKSIVAASLLIVASCLSSSKATELDEAKAEAEHFIQKHFTVQPDGMAFSQLYIKPWGAPGILEAYYQFDGFRWEISEQPLTHADQMNGVKWKGVIGASFNASRTTNRDGDQDPKCWTRWEDVPKWSSGATHDLTWSFEHSNEGWRTSSENSQHWFSWAFGGESATAVPPADMFRPLKLPLCKS